MIQCPKCKLQYTSASSALACCQMNSDSAGDSHILARACELYWAHCVELRVRPEWANLKDENKLTWIESAVIEIRDEDAKRRGWMEGQNTKADPVANVGIVRPMPPVQFEAVTIDSNYYHCPIGGEQISVASLIVMAEDLPEFDLDISGVHIGCEPFGDTRLTPYDLAHHCIRVGAVDITKPVIMNLDGYIMDGWHRVVRALLDGRTHIPAKRFTVQKTFHKAE